MDVLHTIEIVFNECNWTETETLENVIKVVDGDRYLAVYFNDGKQKWYSHNAVISVEITTQEISEDD